MDDLQETLIDRIKFELFYQKSRKAIADGLIGDGLSKDAAYWTFRAALFELNREVAQV